MLRMCAMDGCDWRNLDYYSITKICKYSKNKENFNMNDPAVPLNRVSYGILGNVIILYKWDYRNIGCGHCSHFRPRK